ncbi:glycoside hydrolase family 5 protein [Xylaria acuta]|nr:glycoside hydrolase family 5 protein [Xylaria acuta]
MFGDKIRGFNLGSLFIVEEWFAKDELASMGCKGFYDEWSCLWAKLRIPVGFWIKEDLVLSGEYYPRGGLKYLDRVVGWAGDASLYVTVDLHGVPLAQSPNEEFMEHLSASTANPGFFTDANCERANKFLEWMTERIHTNDAYRTVGMIEIINEPIKRRLVTFRNTDVSSLKNFYPAAWDRIRDRESKLGIAKEYLLHIQCMGSNWESGHPETYLNDTTYLYFDDHVYWKFDTRSDKNKTSYIDATCSLYRPEAGVVVGEFSLSVVGGLQNTAEFGIQGQPRECCLKSDGWIFWNWKCNWINQFNDWRWCYKTAVEAGAILTDASKAASLSPC